VRDRAKVLSAEVLAEELALSEFQASFRVGTPAKSPKRSSEGRVSDSPIRSESENPGGSREKDPITQSLEDAWQHLRVARRVFSEMDGTPPEATQRAMLENLSTQITQIKGIAKPPELLPIWQMTSAMEGLLKQLGSKAASVNPSTLRTLGGALDLLELLCVPGLKADLSTNPPVRLLAVDDDALCLHAVAFALKKALDAPDLATKGDTALALAVQIGYDAIFLDVQLPGMDGFELYAKIHQTALNRNTPVVFVTSTRDFDSRAPAMLAGEAEMIAKPFVIFEITLKALTLVLRRRLGKEIPPVAKPFGNKLHSEAGRKNEPAQVLSSVK
jgi:CheY-like chemotaxis protein